MSKEWQLVTTTHLDSQGEAISENQLNEMLRNFRDQIIPYIQNHDPRIPPVGRMIDAKMVELEDGHKGINALIEFFDTPDCDPIIANREVRIQSHESGKVLLCPDITFKDEESSILELSKTLGSEISFKIKKSSEPLSYLTLEVYLEIGAAVAIAAFFRGYFTKMGEDAWRKSKELFKKLLKHPKGKERFFVLDLTLSPVSDNRNFQVRIVVDDPVTDLELLFEKGMEKFEKTILPSLVKDREKITYFIYLFKNGEFKFSHAISRNGMAMVPPGTSLKFPDLSIYSGVSLEGNAMFEPANSHLNDSFKNVE
jgi:hypothetical protein